MKTLHLLAALVAFTSFARAVDTTPPTLDITNTWIEKRVLPQDGKTYNWFSMYLDPRDETGMNIDNIIFRSALNTSTIPAAQPWQWKLWTRGERFELGFICTSCVIEIRARDAAGNLSPVQTRLFSSPFPYSPAPNLEPMISPADSFTGSAVNCRGLFVGRFDGVGTGDDVLQVDRATGNVMVRRSINSAPTQSDVSFTLGANTIDDSASADFDTDSRADLVVIASGAITVYHNDGLDGSGVVQFGSQTISTTGTGITTFQHVAVGDINGDGKLDIVVSGTDSGGAARIGWLIANATWQYDASDGVPAPTSATAGKVAVGDLNGDGKLDVVMVDAANNQMIIFKNKDTALAGDGETDVNFQPVTIATGLGQGGPNPAIPLIPAPVRALAIGDVTGDGRPDIITVFSEILFSNPLDSNDGRTQQRWRLYENRGATFRPFTDLLLGQSPASQTVLEDIPSDVLLMELTEDRFPEILFTNYYGNSVKVLRFTALLDNQNFLTTLDNGSGAPELDEQDYVPPTLVGIPGHVGPSRLAKGKFKTNASINSFAAAFATSDSVHWQQSAFRSSTAPVSILGGASTDSDPDGTAVANGALAYTVYPNGLIEYSLTIINNTGSPLTGATALVGATFDSLLPPAVTAETLDGGTLVASGTSKLIRWTETIPANTAITKHFTARMVATAVVGSIIQPKNTLKYGTTTLTSSMPKVTLDEPITFELLSVNSDSDPTGAVVRFGEDINYRMRLTNRGKTPITNTIVSMNIPSNSKFSGPVTPVPGTTQVVDAKKTRIDITVPSLAAESVQDLLVYVETTGADIVAGTNVATTIINNTMTAQRPSGTKRTLAAVKTTIKPAIDVEWYSVYSEFSPRDQTAGEPLKGTQVHYGEIIRYRPKLINRSSIAQLNVKIGIPVPGLPQRVVRGVVVPAECVFDGPVSAIPGMTYVVGTGSRRIDYTVTSIPGSTYHPDGSLNTLSVNTDARLDVECRAADYANVTQSATTVQVPGRAIVNPGTYSFLVRPALEIDVKTLPSMTNVKPGDTITYEIQAQNWGVNIVKDAKVINTLPYGTKLKNALQDDGTGTPAGPGPDMIPGNADDIPFRSGDFVGAPINPVALTATSKPAYISGDRLLVWDLGQVEPNQRKVMRYSVTVATDLASAYFYKGISNPLAMMNTNYNFVGTAGTGKRIFAFVPVNPSLAALANADPKNMNSAAGIAPSINVAIDTNAPLPKPQLKLNKHAIGQRIIPDPAPPAEPYAKLPQHQENGEFIFDVDNDSTKVNDAVFDYVLRYTNEGGAAATNLRVKDVLPANTIFLGFLANDNVLVQSIVRSHFYDAAGKEMTNAAAEPFNDTNGNGFYDAGETFTDTNGNHKYDGITAALVRSFDLYAGNLAVGESHDFIYQVLVPDTIAVGTIITSTRGGTTGVSLGLTFTRTAGYYLEADELHFPVNGGPENVKVKITAPASFVLLMPRGFKSAGGLSSGASTTVAAAPRFAAAGGATTMATDEPDGLMLTMPYDVRGDAGAAALPPLSNMKMTFTIPKGYKTDDAYLNSENNVKLKTLNAGAVVEGSSYVSAIRQAEDGRIKVSFPLDGVPFAWPTAHIIYDPLYKSTLVDANGTKDPAYVDVSLTGFYGAGGGTILNATADAATDTITTSAAHGCVPGNWVKFPALNGGTGLPLNTPVVVVAVPSTNKLTVAAVLGGPVIDITSNAIAVTTFQRLPDKTIPTVTSQVRIDSRANTSKDSKIFVGRCAPISVKRGDTFTYTIFYGNLTSLPMNQGTITMDIPKGCVGISATAQSGNWLAGSTEIGSTQLANTIQPKGVANVANDGVTWATPLPSGAGGHVRWSLGSMAPSEGGVVTLTVKAAEVLDGDRIDDNTCVFDVANAMQKNAGPLGVVVRAGDEDGQLAEITQRWLQGAKIKHNDGVSTELKKNFQLKDGSCGVSIGGADVLQITNGVNFIPLPLDRVMLVGPPSKVFEGPNAGGVILRTLVNTPMMRVVVGPGTVDDVSLIDVPGYTPGVVAANQILTDLGVPGLNILAAKGANVLIGNGGNLVRSGATDFTKAGLNGLDAPALILPGGIALLISNSDGTLVGASGSTIVAGGGGNAVTGGGGAILAPGSAGVVANDGAGVVANDGAGLIGHDGSGLIGHDGSGLIGHDGSGLVGKDGARVVANDGAGLVGQDASSIVAGGGLNATQVHNGSQ